MRYYLLSYRDCWFCFSLVAVYASLHMYMSVYTYCVSVYSNDMLTYVLLTSGMLTYVLKPHQTMLFSFIVCSYIMHVLKMREWMLCRLCRYCKDWWEAAILSAGSCTWGASYCCNHW